MIQRAGVAALSLAVLLAGASAEASAKRPLGPSTRIDLNRATAGELMRLPGIGRVRAGAIVAARAKAPFSRVDDVLSVKGISSRWLEKQRGHLVVGGAAGLDGTGGRAAPSAKPAGNR